MVIEATPGAPVHRLALQDQHEIVVSVAKRVLLNTELDAEQHGGNMERPSKELI
jgi:hypothetical protein